MKDVISPHYSPRLQQDADGRLFDPAVRESVWRGAAAEAVPSIEAIVALRQAARRLHLWMERWAEGHGLSEGRLHILLILHGLPGHKIALGQLASHLDVVPRTVTGLVDHLERDGLVTRVPDPDDRRSIYAQLTALGSERVRAIRNQATAHQLAFTRNFSKENLADLRHLCLRLVDTLGDPDGGDAPAANERKGA